jgi:DNA repair protein RadD
MLAYTLPGDPRPYQTDLVDTTVALVLEGAPGVTIQSVTGSGKTRMQVMLVGMALRDNPGCKVILSVSNMLVLEQLSANLAEAGIEHFLLKSTSSVALLARHQVVVAMSQTLFNRITKGVLRKLHFNLIIIDEIHRLLKKSIRLASEWGVPVIGFSATVCRADKLRIGTVTPFIVQGPQPRYLQEHNWMARTATYVFPTIDLGSIRTVTKEGELEYDESALEDALEMSEYLRTVPKVWNSMAQGMQTLAFTPTVQIGKNLESAFLADGVPAILLTAKSSAADRTAAIELLRRNQVNVLVNVGILVEGVDIPSLECIIDLQGTLSRAKQLQKLGRAVRPFEGKHKATILDFVGNTDIHGEVDDSRDWTNGGAVIESNGKRVCFLCFAHNEILSTICKGCEAEHSLEEIAGRLTNVPTVLAAAISRSTPERDCPTWALRAESAWHKAEAYRVANGLRLPIKRKRIEGYSEEVVRKVLAQSAKDRLARDNRISRANRIKTGRPLERLSLTT